MEISRRSAGEVPVRMRERMKFPNQLKSLIKVNPEAISPKIKNSVDVLEK